MTNNDHFETKNIIFERFLPLSKFHFPACSTLHIYHGNILSGTHGTPQVKQIKFNIEINSPILPETAKSNRKMKLLLD